MIDALTPLTEIVGADRSRVPALRVSPALAPVLPDGLRRGSTIAVSGSVSLLLATVGAASADGAWCALVAMPTISAEAARGFGIELARLPMVPSPGPDWVAVVGALLDAVDVVVARVPDRLTDGDIRRLAARVRAKGAVFVPYRAAARPAGAPVWPHAELSLRAEAADWDGIGTGYGRLRRRRVTVCADGRGRPRSTGLWLPAATGGTEPVVAAVVEPVVEPVPFAGPPIVVAEPPVERGSRLVAVR
ncbi:MAG TPA: hypothetical protein VME70_10235 [Mycobacteriales bacterium]|nr:hypothetical protein [Mycobacteriales bacterium]